VEKLTCRSEDIRCRSCPALGRRSMSWKTRAERWWLWAQTWRLSSAASNRK